MFSLILLVTSEASLLFDFMGKVSSVVVGPWSCFKKILMDSCTIATKIWLLISSALVLAVEVSIGAVRAPYTARHFALPLTVRTSADAVSARTCTNERFDSNVTIQVKQMWSFWHFGMLSIVGISYIYLNLNLHVLRHTLQLFSGCLPLCFDSIRKLKKHTSKLNSKFCIYNGPLRTIRSFICCMCRVEYFSLTLNYRVYYH